MIVRWTVHEGEQPGFRNETDLNHVCPGQVVHPSLRASALVDMNNNVNFTGVIRREI